MRERTKTIPLESENVSVAWFTDSESIVIAYSYKFQIFNALSPDKMILSVDVDLLIDQRMTPPKMVFNDRIVIFIGKNFRLKFFDI